MRLKDDVRPLGQKITEEGEELAHWRGFTKYLYRGQFFALHADHLLGPYISVQGADRAIAQFYGEW